MQDSPSGVVAPTPRSSGVFPTRPVRNKASAGQAAGRQRRAEASCGQGARSRAVMERSSFSKTHPSSDPAIY